MPPKNPKEYAKAYYEENKSWLKPYYRSYYKAHKEELKARMRARYRKMKEVDKPKYKAYQEANRTKINERRRAWHRRTKNSRRGVLTKHLRRYREGHRDELRARSKAERERVKERVISLFGGKCVRCGFSDARALQVDHVDGCKVPISNRHQAEEVGQPLYRAILRGEKDIKLYQLLCANCNWIKRHENGEFGNYKRRASEIKK